MRVRTDFFKCLHCGGADATASDAAWRCEGCGVSYPAESGIPLLVRDTERHEEELAAARRLRPGWHVEEQPPEVASPWRHHLRKRREYVEFVLRRHLRKKGCERTGMFLDMGCGDGNNLAFLRSSAAQTYGCDYNVLRLRRAQERFPDITFFVADILDFPARDQVFDVVYMNHVLEHIVRDSEALKSAGRVLRPGGLLILGAPNEGAWWWQMAYRLQPEVRRATDHVNFYTANDLVRKLEDVGLRVTEVRHLGWGPPHWGLDARIRKYKLIDDGFECFGRMFLRKQASSLYVLATRDE